MREIANSYKDTYLIRKLNEMAIMLDVNKKNRWFGYFQYYGECKGYWSLDDVIAWVREDMKDIITAAISDEELSDTRKKILATLHEKGRLTYIQIADVLNKSKATIHDNLKVLVTMDLVKRIRMPMNKRGQPPILYCLRE